MNGPTVVLLLAAAVIPMFIGIVWVDRWLDRREQRQMTYEAERYARAVARLSQLQQENPGRVRLGHQEDRDELR
jgi:hypothetical protein